MSRAFVLVLLLAHGARAEQIATSSGQLIEVPSPERAGHDKLGFRLALGRLALAESAPLTFGLGVHLEHAVFAKWRLLAEYEWLWMMEREPDGNRDLTLVGHGHRLHAGLRRALVGKRALRDLVKLFVDVELGGGLGIVTTTMDPAILPHGFLGLRAGYSFASDHARSSKSLEGELHLRAIATDTGLALAFGVGWTWSE